MNLIQKRLQSIEDADDDLIRKNKTGNRAFTVSAHIITAAITDVLLLAIARPASQLGLISGPVVIVLFGVISLFTSDLFFREIRRNYDLGFGAGNLCELFQIANLFAALISYTMGLSTCIRAIQTSNCFENGNCGISNSDLYIIIFGVAQILFSQSMNFDYVWFLFTILALVMAILCSSFIFVLQIALVIVNGTIKGNLRGVCVNDQKTLQRIWRRFQAIGEIALKYNCLTVLFKIQDALRSPSESKTMRRAIIISVIVITILNALSGYFGYAAFGDSIPTEILTGFKFYNSNWPVNIIHIAVIIEVSCAYQLDSQLMVAIIEKFISEKYPNSNFINKDIKIFHLLDINLFRLVCLSLFVIIITLATMFLPSMENISKLIRALSFWTLAFYYPVNMYITQKEIHKWSAKWLSFQILSVAGLIITIAVAAGSIAEMVHDFKAYK